VDSWTFGPLDPQLLGLSPLIRAMDPAADYAALPTANAGQYATWICKPLLFGFPCKRPYINVGSFKL